MRKSTIEQVIECANSKFHKVQEMLAETEHMWNKPMDLKLHDACGMTVFTKDIAGGKVTIELDGEEADSLFDIFCQDAFSTFRDMTFEDLKIFLDFNDIADYIGRTSKFYLTTMHNDYKNKYITALYEIVNDLFDIELKMENGTIKVDFDKTMEYYDEDYERLYLDLTYIINDIVDDVESVLKDVKMVYNYIENFKKEQKEMFTEYVFSVYNFND